VSAMLPTLLALFVYPAQGPASIAARLGRGEVMPRIDLHRQTLPDLGGIDRQLRGTLRLEIVVGRDGRPLHSRLVASPDPTGRLERVVVAAMSKWKFSPAVTYDGPVTTLVELAFDVEPASGSGWHPQLSPRLRQLSDEPLPNNPEAWTGARSIEGSVVAPQVKREIIPSYTSEAMRAKIQGIVHLEIVINEDGTVGAVRLTKSLDREHGLDREAMAAARYWLFEPAKLDGRPVKVRAELDLEFRLH
jgi:TonB family protein